MSGTTIITAVKDAKLQGDHPTMRITETKLVEGKPKLKGYISLVFRVSPGVDDHRSRGTVIEAPFTNAADQNEAMQQAAAWLTELQNDLVLIAATISAASKG